MIAKKKKSGETFHYSKRKKKTRGTADLQNLHMKKLIQEENHDMCAKSLLKSLPTHPGTHF